MHSLLPGKSSGEITGNEIDNQIPDVTGALITGPCTAGNSGEHHQSSHLPGASGVHIFMVSGSSIEPLCTGALYVRRGQEYSDEVVTASRCVPSSVKVINGVESFPLPYSGTGASARMQCYISGVCQHGMPVRVQYQLLTPTECKQHLGDKFLPSVMYCGVGQKNVLQYPVGSPLLCQSSGSWVQFGIYDHSFSTSHSNAAQQSENEIIPDDIALFVKLEGDNVGHVQNFKTFETSFV
ncbi:hypothetical protein M514_26156 [Trichuris suis]|uniref:Peptidase S1 domain-containing protein n=1 Tax=Trichuris suis TaxID=68888 RepID=A0A085MWP1_9BILA|nr:hypothetical protein M514_26156 [Trichuris suis]